LRFSPRIRTGSELPRDQLELSGHDLNGGNRSPGIAWRTNGTTTATLQSLRDAQRRRPRPSMKPAQKIAKPAITHPDVVL
jgi:hypothetical protein